MQTKTLFSKISFIFMIVSLNAKPTVNKNLALNENLELSSTLERRSTLELSSTMQLSIPMVEHIKPFEFSRVVNRTFRRTPCTKTRLSELRRIHDHRKKMILELGLFHRIETIVNGALPMF